MRIEVTREEVAAGFDAIKDVSGFSEIQDRIQQGGLPGEMMQVMSLRPEILRVMAALGAAIYPGGVLELALKERVILAASLANACQFCIGAHTASMRQLGIPTDSLESPGDWANLPERDRLALAYTRAAMADSNRIPEEHFTQLQAAFTKPELVELTFVIGTINMLNIFNNCLQVTYPDPVSN
jgi:AhpD family alkylhydroperoxidase